MKTHPRGKADIGKALRLSCITAIVVMAFGFFVCLIYFMNTADLKGAYRTDANAPWAQIGTKWSLSDGSACIWMDNYEPYLTEIHNSEHVLYYTEISKNGDYFGIYTVETFGDRYDDDGRKIIEPIETWVCTSYNDDSFTVEVTENHSFYEEGKELTFYRVEENIDSAEIPYPN